MSVRRDWHLPLEHGAWGMLYVPFVLGCFAGRGFSWRTLLLFVASTSIFMARAPVLAWARAMHWKKPPGTAPRFACLYLGIAAAAGLPLLVAGHLWGLLIPAAAGGILLGLNTWQALRREDRTVIGEIAAIAGLSMAAPTAYYVTRGQW